jgi:hypothetical protein
VIGAACTFQTHGDPLPEEFLMMHNVLAPLLFKREELRSVPRSERAKEKDRSRVTITSSPLYSEAVKKFYDQLTRKVQSPTPPSSSSAPSSQPAEPFHFTDLPEAQLRPSSSAPTIKGYSSPIIDLRHDVLLWAIVWVANGSQYQTTLLSPNTNDEGQFSVRAVKSELGRNAKFLETYDPLTENWRKVPWDTTVGPLHYDGRVILFRHPGVTDLQGFDRVKSLADRLSGSKGYIR